MKRFLLFTFLIGFLGTGIVMAKSPAAGTDKRLLDIVSRLKSADGYYYETNIVTTDLNKPKEHLAQKMAIYQSRQQFVLYSKSDDVLFFLDKDGQFRVNAKDKKVYYRQTPNDSEQHRMEKKFNSAAALNMIDSTFLKNAVIDGIKTDGDLVKYKLTYPPGIQVRELTIVFNTRDQFFDHISYKIDRVSTVDHKTVVMKQEVTMMAYSQSVPAAVNELKRVSPKMLEYLRNTYQGYKMVKI